MRVNAIVLTGMLCLMTYSRVLAAPIVIKPKESSPAPPKAPAVRPGANIPKTSPTGKENEGLQTLVQVDISSPEILGDPSAQNWGKLFEDLGLSVRIRNGQNVTMGVSEKTRGSLRFVTATGLLARNGQIAFGDKAFQLSDKDAIKQWVDELKAYGAQGAPTGKVMWGMNQAQIEIVSQQMKQPLTVEASGKTVSALVKSLQSGTDLPIHLASETEIWLQDPANNRPISLSVSGFSVGSGLAVALNDVGAGFRPLRTPAGKIEYQVLPLDQLKDAWPLGWEPKDETPRNLITPELFKMGVVGFDEAPLAEVLAAIQVESKTPIIVDHRKIQARNIDLGKIIVSYPQKRSAWAVVITQNVRKAGLYNSYRQDEAGTGFIVIAPYEPKIRTPTE